ncbi:MAG: P-loop NTPase [Planctomycetota bacterium]|jgi:ATP-binding protein involved in chromosome partitioning
MTDTQITEAAVKRALRVVEDPDLKQDIVELGFVKNVVICGGSVKFDVELTTPACPVKEKLKQEAHDAVMAIAGVESVAVTMTAQVRPSINMPGGGLSGVKNVVAVASGKGGVGKSTVTANLALALARTGAKVGLMDADVYGPSIPHMLGGMDRPEQVKGTLQPIERHGIKFISMGLLTGRSTPVIWRGPMASKLIQQFLGQVEWGELDYLLIDLPPGTGDVQLTLTQSAPLTGAVVVTTPQEVAVTVTLRGLRMFEQVHVPILGIIENMSYFVCPSCDEKHEIFRTGTGKAAAEELGFNYLGGIPIDPALSLAGDLGTPLTGATEDDLTPAGKAMIEIAGRVAQQISIVNAKTAAVKQRPKEIKSEGPYLVTTWYDDTTTRTPFFDLRAACPCAMCVDEWSGEKKLDPDTLKKDVHPVEVRPVGRYGIQPIWSDGHATGIYTFDFLHSMSMQFGELIAAGSTQTEAAG